MYQLNKFKDIENLVHGVSTVNDGNMSFNWGDEKEVIRNRKKFLQKLNVLMDNCAISNLAHGTQIKTVGSNHKGQMFGDNKIIADALITSEKNLFLFVLTADCLPIIFYDPKKEILVLAHISILNTGKQFAEKIVTTLKKKYFCNPTDLIVGFGPAIHKESYMQRKEELKQIKIEDWKDFLKDLPGDKMTIDIIGHNKKQLIDAGVREKNIEISPVDTAKSPDFFSHYRSKKTGQVEGRFATVVGMV